MNKFNLALLSLLLSFTCFANIDGTFIQTWLYSYWTDERWEAEISSMKEIGIQEIIMADIASRSNSNEPWSCSYPSQLSNTSLSADETTKILKQAKKGGVKVYLGLGCDSRWWNWNLCKRLCLLWTKQKQDTLSRSMRAYCKTNTMGGLECTIHTIKARSN